MGNSAVDPGRDVVVDGLHALELELDDPLHVPEWINDTLAGYLSALGAALAELADRTSPSADPWTLFHEALRRARSCDPAAFQALSSTTGPATTPTGSRGAHWLVLNDLTALIGQIRDGETDEWENPTLDQFLDAFAALLGSIENTYTNIGLEVPDDPWMLISRALTGTPWYE